MKLRVLALTLIATGGALTAHAAEKTWTMAQVESRYPAVSSIHIERCDRDGDGLFTRSERACVEGIYDTLYRDR